MTDFTLFQSLSIIILLIVSIFMFCYIAVCANSDFHITSNLKLQIVKLPTSNKYRLYFLLGFNIIYLLYFWSFFESFHPDVLSLNEANLLVSKKTTSNYDFLNSLYYLISNIATSGYSVLEIPLDSPFMHKLMGIAFKAINYMMLFQWGANAYLIIIGLEKKPGPKTPPVPPRPPSNPRSSIDSLIKLIEKIEGNDSLSEDTINALKKMIKNFEYERFHMFEEHERYRMLYHEYEKYLEQYKDYLDYLEKLNE